MPTLIRLLIVLVVLAGIGLAAMIALTVMVDPGEKDVTIRIPARELAPTIDHSDPLKLNDLPPPVNIAPRSESVPAEPDSVESGASAAGVETVEAGGAE